MPPTIGGHDTRQVRVVPSKLEIEVEERFRKWDTKYAGARAKLYPHLVKPTPGVGAPGKGSVMWVGLNPDPCKQKFLNKHGGRSSSTPALSRPASAPASGRSCQVGVPPAGWSEETTLLRLAEEDNAAVEDDRTRPKPGGLQGLESKWRARAMQPGLETLDNDAAEPQPQSTRHCIPRPSSAPPRSRQAQKCADILERGGTSSLEQACLIRELRTGQLDPTSELRAPLGAGAGIPKKAAWISSKYDQYTEVAAQPPARPPKLRENEEIVGYPVSGSASNTRMSGQPERPSSAGLRRPPSAGRLARPTSAGSRPASAGSARIPLRELSQNLAGKTCNQHYIEQKLGVSTLGPFKNPNITPDDPLELLYVGFTKDPDLRGRHAYLKERQKLGPQKKSRCALTCSDDIGWTLDGQHAVRPARQKPCSERPSMVVI